MNSEEIKLRPANLGAVKKEGDRLINLMSHRAQQYALRHGKPNTDAEELIRDWTRVMGAISGANFLLFDCRKLIEGLKPLLTEDLNLSTTELPLDVKEKLAYLIENLKL